MSNSTIVEQAKTGVLSAAQFELVGQINAGIWTVMSIFGIITNTINIRVFMKMGIEDGVTLSFQFLSLSDLGFVMTLLIQSVAICMQTLEKEKLVVKLYIDPFAVNIFAANLGLMISLFSTLITTFLAVARCMCIVKPLHFKNDFSKKRSLHILVVFMIFSIACFIPVFATTGMTEHKDQATNTTRLVLLMRRYRAEIYTVNELITDTLIPILAEIIVIVCVAVMAQALHKAYQFRQSIKVDKTKSQTSEMVIEDRSEKGKAALDSGKLSGKDLQVVQQVVLICIIFIISNTPKIITALYAGVEPEFALGKRYNNIYFTVRRVRKMLEIINASVNIFVYYEYNSKYKQFCSFC